MLPDQFPPFIPFDLSSQRKWRIVAAPFFATKAKKQYSNWLVIEN